MVIVGVECEKLYSYQIQLKLRLTLGSGGASLGWGFNKKGGPCEIGGTRVR